MAATKCNYSAKYKPLVLAKRALFGENRAAFQKWVSDTFLDPEYAMTMLNASQKTLSDLKIEQRKIAETPKEIDSIRSYYSNNSTGYNNCVSEFRNKMIEASIFNRHNNQWINADAIVEGDDVNILNKNIFEYKLELLDRINRAFPNDGINSNIDINDANADELLTEAIYKAINSVDKYSFNIDASVYAAYVILKNFNRLLKERTKFIGLRKEYENTASHGKNMYVYNGPTVKHRTSWTTNEHVSAQSQYSDLALALLDYFPEFNGLSHIPNTSIGRDGFTSVMNKFKTALFYSDELAKHRTAYFNGGFNIKEALEDYLAMIKNSTKFSDKHVDRSQLTTQVYKLQGIIHYIYESKLSDDVKEMFTGMFQKTVPLSYMTYMWKNGKFGAINLIDSYVNTQMLNLQDIVNGQVMLLRDTPDDFARLTEKWGINVKRDVITISPKGNEFTITINIAEKQTGKSSSYEVTPSVRGVLSEDVLNNILTDVLGVYLPSTDYSECSALVNNNGSMLNDFADLLAITLIASDPELSFPAYNIVDKVIDFKKLYLFTNFERAAKTLSVLYGSDVRNVVNDINGNHLPTNGLTSLAFNAPKMAAEMAGWQGTEYDDPFTDNFLCPRENARTGYYSAPGFLPPIIRQGVKFGGKTKAVSDLKLGELLEIGAIYDYWDNLNKGNVIYLQNTNLADKERHLLIGYTLREISIKGSDKTYNMDELLKNVADGKTSSDELIEVWQKIRKSRYTAIANNIVKDYNEVFGKAWTSLLDVDDYLKKNPITIESIRQKFHNAGVIYKEEIHGTESGGHVSVNETLLHYLNTFNNVTNAEKRLNKSRAYFANDMFKSRLKINRYTNDVINIGWDKIKDEWKEKRGNIETGNLILFKVFDGSKEIKVSASDPTILTNPKYKVVLNPIFESYLMADIIYSNLYNQICVGDVFSHPTKTKEGDTSDNGFGSSEYYDTCEATRLVAQNKRAVIYGGSIHSFQHDLANNRGVAKQINVAVIKDMEAYVWNLIGGLKNKSVDDSIDPMDGAGLQSIYEAILEQESLKDAAAGVDEKTILGWNDKFFGKQMLLKWAVYALTNERRRMSRTSQASAENLFKRMHSKIFSKTLNMQTIWRKHVNSDIYFKDFDSRQNYKITGVTQAKAADGKEVYVRTAVAVSNDGTILDPNNIVYLTNRNQIVKSVNNSSDFIYNTLYDLDQFFGGAYEETLNNGKLEYSDKGNHIVVDIICEENLKDYFIAYAVNTTAVKVGAENINEANKWNDGDLWTMKMSTEYGGLQMNAEHELDDSEVSEMTQMISALMEKGFDYELVKQIYSDIGEVVLEALKTVKGAIKNYGNDPDKLKIMFGKALIEAYAKGDRDTLGLAQSFLAKAERMLRERNIDFKFPFSGATIHGSFIATVSSMLTKRGIRRKYSGIAAVLTPSHNMIQVYGDGKTLEKHADYIAEWRNQPGNDIYRNTSIESLINDLYVESSIGVVANPFIKLDSDKTFTFEDTIVIEEFVLDENGNKIWDGQKYQTRFSEPRVIEKYEDYDFFKHRYGGNVYIFTSRPRNLRGSETTFRINTDLGRTNKISIYDSGATRAANFSIKKNWSDYETQVILDVLDHAISNYSEDIIYNEGFISDDLSNAIATKDRKTIESTINVRKTLYNIIQRQLRNLANKGTFNDVYLTKGLTVNVSDVNVSSAEIIMGKLFAKQFLLQKGDSIDDILGQGSDFFYTRICNKFAKPNVHSDKYDAIVYTKTGDKILVKVDNDLEYNFDKASNPNIIKVDGKVYLNQEELCIANNKEFFQIQDNDGQLQNVIVIKSSDDFYELVNSNQIAQYRINYDGNPNVAIQLTLDTDENDTYDLGNSVYITYEDLKFDRNLSPEEIVEVMKHSEMISFEKRVRRQAERMAESFELSLNFVGTRIPAQAMQSFQPMRIVAFTDSETNDVYVNRHNTFLEGSDYKNN